MTRSQNAGQNGFFLCEFETEIESALALEMCRELSHKKKQNIETSVV